MSKNVQSDASRDGINSLTIAVNSVRDKVDDVQSDVTEIKQKLESKYVTTDQFEPVRNVVYGMVGVVLLAVVGALIALVIKG